MTPNDEHSNEHTVPHRWEADVVLYDGSVAVVRPVHPDDVDALKAFYGRVSPESKYLRFFGAHPELEDSDIDAWVNVDMHDAVTLVLLDKEDIVGTARYELVQAFLPERVGDVSFLVQDDHHGNGVATSCSNT
ncbi:GNAT family N-acetyltransferase [Corynebacterium argentoratense]|uniref:GNAT family N-acetyltransferase n=1 Tax=Corynebacterium argentoratense TaxID=42817 RepID=UPI000695EE0B|nr:GNAT family N-acetyltransferase [Corynebacterium argentoratense]